MELLRQMLLLGSNWSTQILGEILSICRKFTKSILNGLGILTCKILEYFINGSNLIILRMLRATVLCIHQSTHHLTMIIIRIHTGRCFRFYLGSFNRLLFRFIILIFVVIIRGIEETIIISILFTNGISKTMSILGCKLAHIDNSIIRIDILRTQPCIKLSTVIGRIKRIEIDIIVVFIFVLVIRGFLIITTNSGCGEFRKIIVIILLFLIVFVIIFIVVIDLKKTAVNLLTVITHRLKNLIILVVIIVFFLFKI